MATKYFFEDQFSSVPESAQFGLNLTFYIPSAKAGETFAEAVSATIPGSLCLKPKGHSIVRAFDDSAASHQTNVMMHITCRTSGRISISLASESNHNVKVYEGRFSDGEKVAFPGIPGSYYAGILTMYRLHAREPKGPWFSVNTCQQSNTCKDLDVH